MDLLHDQLGAWVCCKIQGKLVEVLNKLLSDEMGNHLPPLM